MVQPILPTIPQREENAVTIQTTKPHVHLIANSHIDPMYMWQWEEGVAEASPG